MDKREYFFACMEAELHLIKAWVIAAFSITREEPDAWKKNPYHLRLVREGGQCYYVDARDEAPKLVQITGGVKGEPLYSFKEAVKVKSSEVPNLTTDVETKYGSLLFNYIVLIWPFGEKIEYRNGLVDTGQLEDEIATRLTEGDAPVVPPGEYATGDQIYVSELVRYGEAIGALAGYTQLCVPGASERMITADPVIIARRDALVEEYKDQLSDPAIVAKIEKELTDLYMERMKGDPGEGFLVKGKTSKVTLKKAYIMHGVESGFAGVGEDTITSSLHEGWEIDKIPAYINSLRSGSYSRGSETELGGVEVKGFYRVFQNTIIAEEDCGVKYGLDWKVTEDKIKSMVGLYEILPRGAGKTQPLTLDYLKGKIGQTIQIRSPMLCKTKAPSFCAQCLGDNYGRNPKGLSVAAAEVGSTFMSLFMAAMHGKELATAPLNISETIT